MKGIEIKEEKVERRGRPKKVVEASTFDPSQIKLVRGNALQFNESLFIPLKTNKEIDIILSTEGGIMPGTNIVLVGGAGSGKTTIALDWLSAFTEQGYKCLYVSAEMDEIGHFRYCKRIPHIGIVQTLFLKNHLEHIKETLEYEFNQGYDIIVVDSIAEVLEAYKSTYKTTESKAENWFLSLQDKMKRGENIHKYNTTFINVQQVTKGDDFVGSNRLKHMTDGMCHIEKSKDGLERSMYFSKNRDCDKDFKVFFSIWGDGVHYSFEQENQ